MDPHHQIGSFLRARRARLTPADAGLVDTGRRRVAGLRREEVAQLAGVSVDYYVRLEQGRAHNPSVEVVDAISRALRLDSVERDHLITLLKPVTRTTRARRTEPVRPALKMLLDQVDVPAFLLDRRLSVLDANRLASALVLDWSPFAAAERNTARSTFLDPAARDYYCDWEDVARETVGYLRLAAGSWPDDPQLTALVGELLVKDKDFARFWTAQEVRLKNHGSKALRHPVAGELTVHYETLSFAPDNGQHLVLYSCEPGSASADALQFLAAWTKDQAKPEVRARP